jgi:S1-C subfamily serine protease
MISMKRSWLSGVLAVSLAVASAGSAVLSTPAAMAQGFEYSPDLGVLVEHTGGGFVVRAMRRGAFARQLGLRPGDLVFAVNGDHPDSLNDLHRVLFTGADEEDHDLDIFRNGRHLHASVFHSHGEIFVHTALH